MILAAPHRQLHDNPDLVSLAEVTEADADVLLDILHVPERWVRATGFPLAERLQGPCANTRLAAPSRRNNGHAREPLALPSSGVERGRAVAAPTVVEESSP